MELLFTQDIGGIRQMLPRPGRVFVILDDALETLTPAFEGCSIIRIHASEGGKTMETVLRIAERLSGLGADRDSFLLGVGGGITCDLTGFTAAIYKRGVRFAFVPTTLLAQADASIGGKNGVNFQGFKNILGTIRQPEWVCICTELLRTLPLRYWREGIAEMLKTFAIYDAASYRQTLDFFAVSEPDIWLNSSVLSMLISRCTEIKMGVISRDEQECGERRLLNFGHTFAHAIEKVSRATEDAPEGLLHGEAVAIGMVLAARVAEAVNLCELGLADELAGDLRSVGLPVSCELPADGLTRAIAADKKVSSDAIHLILPAAIGDVRDVMMPLTQLQSLIHSLLR